MEIDAKVEGSDKNLRVWWLSDEQITTNSAKCMCGNACHRLFSCVETGFLSLAPRCSSHLQVTKFFSVSDMTLIMIALDALQARLKGTDRVTYGDEHSCDTTVEGERAALAHITAAIDKHGRVHDSVVDRVTATIRVIKLGFLGFRHAISHVDNREEQLAFGGHLLDSRRRFLTDPLAHAQDTLEFQRLGAGPPLL